jgi:hypothetical protein
LRTTFTFVQARERGREGVGKSKEKCGRKELYQRTETYKYLRQVPKLMNFITLLVKNVIKVAKLREKRGLS